MSSSDNDKLGTVVAKPLAQCQEPPPQSDTAPGLSGSDSEVNVLHWYPWHPNKWFSSASVRKMTFEERGIYRELLDWQWQEHGYLTGDIVELSAMVGCDLARFPKVLTRFPLLPDGRRANPVLLAIFNEQTALHEAHSLSGKKRWKSKNKSKNKNKRDACASHEPSTSEASMLSDSCFMLKMKQLYTWLDVDKEISKMQAWLLTPKARGRKLTRRFIVNWLNRQDKPMEDQTKSDMLSGKGTDSEYGWEGMQNVKRY